MTLLIEFHIADTPRTRANRQARKERSASAMRDHRYHKCHHCDGDKGADTWEGMCLPCEGTGLSPLAPYWDR